MRVTGEDFAVHPVDNCLRVRGEGWVERDSIFRNYSLKQINFAQCTINVKYL